MSLSRNSHLMHLAREVCRELRKNQTHAEQIMWGGLRANRFREKNFLRQHPIFVDANGRETFYVADFYCHEHRLAIELDGRIHERTKERDEVRTMVINDQGIEVLRFRNEEVEKDFNGVLERLAEKLNLPPRKDQNSPLTPACLNENSEAGRPPLEGEGDVGLVNNVPTSPLFPREGQGESFLSTIWSALAKIQDPEIPVLSLVEMKIIRSVTVTNGEVSVVMSPTFVGCPALDHMKEEIHERLRNLGCEKVKIAMVNRYVGRSDPGKIARLWYRTSAEIRSGTRRQFEYNCSLPLLRFRADPYAKSIRCNALQANVCVRKLPAAV